MACGGGVGAARLATSFTLFGGAGVSSFSRDIMFDVLRGSEGFARPPVGTGVPD